MKIKNIRIDGYKNLTDTIVEFNGLNALIALNNYGKSNFFEAVEFGNDFIQASEKSKITQMQYQNAVPINNTTADKDYTFEIEFEILLNKVKTSVNYMFSFEWIKQDNKGSKITKETLRVKSEEDTKPTTYINRNLKSKLYKPSKTGRCDKSIKIRDNALIINKLSNFDDLFYIEIVEAINNLEFDFISMENIDKYFVPQANAIIDNSGSFDTYEIPSIGKFFYNLHKNDNDKYQLLNDLILDLLPDIEYIKPIQIDFKSESIQKDDIPFEVPEKIYDIRVKIRTNNQDTSINNLSEGSKRIFHILTTAIIADYSGTHLLAYEELENSIHPALLQRLLIIISELTDSAQVIITSHSPHLIKYLDLDNIYIGIPNNLGTAYFKKIKKTKQNKLIQYAKDSENNLGDFVFDMLVEGFENDSFWSEFI